MQNNMDAQAEAHLQQSGVTLAACVRVTLTDGRVFAFTNFTEPLEFKGVIYQPTSGQTPSAVQTTSGLAPDTIDIETIKSMIGVTTTEIASGALDAAEFEYFILNYKTLTQDFGTLRRGTLGQITDERSRSQIELRGLVEQLSKQILEMYSPACRADVFDSRCGVPLDPPEWAATTSYALQPNFDARAGSTVKPSVPNNRYFRCVTAGDSGGTEPAWNLTLGGTTNDGTVVWETIESKQVTGTVTNVSTATKRVFQDTSLDKPDTFFSGGLITWLTGNNAGFQYEVKRFEKVATIPEIEFILSTFNPIQIGDTYLIQAGCTKRLIEDCKTKFNNTYNNRSEPYVPHNFTLARATI